jgi:hypothetical protein
MAVVLPSNPSGSQAIDLGQNGVRNVLEGVSGGTLCIWARHFALPTGAPGTAFNWGSYSRGTPTNASSNVARLEIETQVNVATGALIIGLGRSTDSEGLVFVTGATQFPVLIQTTQHLAVVADFANKTISCYVDGNLAGMVTGASFTANQTSLFPPRSGAIGMEEDLTTTTENVPGTFEDFRVYDVNLTDAEIKTIASCRGTDGIVRFLRSRYEFLDLPTGTVCPTGAVRDFGPDQFNTSGQNSPTYTGSLTTKYRRRLP